MALPEVICVRDVEKYAIAHLNKNALGYYDSGADDEETLNDNINACKKLRLRPRMLVDVTKVDCSTTILGQKISFPVGIAPSAMQRMAHPDGEIATVKAADSLKTCMTLSTLSTTSMESVAEASPNTLRWFQLYVVKDREITRQFVKRAEKSGYKALVLTVDAPVLGNRRIDVRNRFHLPPHLSLGNFEKVTLHIEKNKKSDSELSRYFVSEMDASLTWKDITWLKSITSLPVIVKGILTAEDAEMAVSVGVEGIWVSNHGGRQLDGVPTAIEALPEIVKAVNNRAEIYADGGFRSGTDVFKAIALGARAVFVGRPILWGLVYNGQKGVEKVLQLLQQEFHRTMQLSGCVSIKDIKSSLITYASSYSKL
ncbi:Hydroxyacid oxidase 1 [Trichoplax sp. H2]|nr:Hydroxyacid oxidase 1 [Trichoplax sp. H2]|eukprot:RDD47321.1 Hydroxyacid oxidase 1 [Trichoplax sp. H2]